VAGEKTNQEAGIKASATWKNAERAGGMGHGPRAQSTCRNRALVGTSLETLAKFLDAVSI
jgi:hypothetical protein